MSQYNLNTSTTHYITKHMKVNFLHLIEETRYKARIHTLPHHTALCHCSQPIQYNSQDTSTLYFEP